MERLDIFKLDGSLRVLALRPAISAAAGVDIGSPHSPMLYHRPSYSGNDALFADLVSYLPGMQNSSADLRHILETETVESLLVKFGRIDEQARQLIDNARSKRWRAWTTGDEEKLTLYFNGDGRYAFDQTLPLGIREKVVCDGETLRHLYPQLHIGARRQVSRFHRANLAAMVPWFVPPAEDLSRGADVKLAGERTVAVIPHRAPAEPADEDKQAEWLQAHLVFAADGTLAERQLVQMPDRKILYRLICSPTGTVRLLDEAGKELGRVDGKLESATAPVLAIDTKDLVVLPLPYRTREQVRQALKIEDKSVEQLTFAEALPLFAAEFAAGNTSEAHEIFRQVYHQRNQRQLGYYVLLAACGHNLDAQHGDVLAEHLDEPLAQYLALHSSPVLRKHASQWAVSSQQWQEPFLQYLAITHALYQRWQSDNVLKGEPAKIKAEIERALEYVRQNRTSHFGWALLCLMQDRAGDRKDVHRALADAWLPFEKLPGLTYAARYEHARSLFKSGAAEPARAAFVKLYGDVFKEYILPPIDADFRAALLVKGTVVDAWSELLEGAARSLIAKKERPAVVELAWQCWQVEDRALANHLLDLALADDCPVEVRVAGLGFLWRTGQYPAADQLLDRLLADAELAERPELWRFGVTLADKRGRNARALECLEKALELAEKQASRLHHEDYGRLLEHYQQLADAMVTLRINPPVDFLSKVIAAADRWRASEPSSACTTAAGILRILGERELAWDYLTTPVGLRPNEAEPWVELAGSLRTQGDLALAELAFKAASEAEPTNAQILWDRAVNLLSSGRTTQAQDLFRRIAEGDWQPRFQGLRSQASLRLSR